MPQQSICSWLYLKPVSEGRFRAEGKCLREGKNVLFSQAQVFDDREALVCSASSQCW
jgi:acyl-coenzyme A thioesterase PaaI-like protein